MKRILIFLLLPFIFWSNSLSAALSVSVQNNSDYSNSDNTVNLDDIIELVISSNSNIDTQLDLSPLSKDFVVVSQAKQVSHTIINGNATSKRQWILGLQAKKTGTLTIPALQWGNEQSEPLQINIKPAKADPQESSDIFMTVEADNQSVYLQSPLTITVNIYISAEITARNLELNTPDQTDYNLFKLSETNRQVFYKNKRYNLFQVKYLGFYNKPGTLNLPVFNLSGVKLKDNSTHNDIFSLYQQKWSQFNRTNPPIAITILPKPASFNDSNWLSADNLSIEQSWTPDLSANKSLPVGEAIQRIITIKGKNVQAEQLPIPYDINTKAPDNSSYKIYVDKPEVHNSIVQDKIQSILTQKITYITSQPGQLDIPGQKISWWNNKTKLREEAVLPNTVLTIVLSADSATKVASTSATNSNNNTQANQNSENLANNTLTANFLTEQLPKLTSPGEPPPQQTYMLTMLAIIIFLLIMVISYLLILVRKHYRLNKDIPSRVRNYDYKNFINYLKQSAKLGNPEDTYKQLGELASLLHQNFNGSRTNDSLAWLKQQLSIDANHNINTLAANLYGKSQDAWDNKLFVNTVIPELKELYKNLSAIKNNKNNKSRLKDIYPD